MLHNFFSKSILKPTDADWLNARIIHPILTFQLPKRGTNIILKKALELHVGLEKKLLIAMEYSISNSMLVIDCRRMLFMMIVEGAGGVVVVVIVAGLKLEVIDDEICEIVGGTVFFFNFN